MSSQEPTDDQDTHYFMVDKTTLVCLIDLDQDLKACRVIMRDVCGRHCWESVCFYDSPETTIYASLRPDFHILQNRETELVIDDHAC